MSVLRDWCRLILSAAVWVTVVAGVGASSHAAIDEWQGIGPYGGKVLALAGDPSDAATVYAGTNQGGLFKTTDGGANWKLSRRMGTVFGIVVDPASTSTVYAASTGGVWKSTDGGQNWNKLPFPNTATCIVMDPATPSTLYAGTDSGIYRTTDAGASWHQVLASWDDAFMSIAISKNEPSKLYARTNSGYGFRSVDGGITWMQMNLFDASAMFVSPTNAELVFLGGSGIRRSTDGGITWTVTFPEAAANDIVFDPTNPNLVYVATYRGVYVSNNAGLTWQPHSNEETSITKLLLDPATNAPAYAAGVDGVLKSGDAGRTFALASNGICAHTVSFAVNPFNTGEILSGSTFYDIPGGFRTPDGGANWTRTTWSASALAYDPVTPSTVFSNYGKSTNGGQTWSYYGLSNVVDILVDPMNPLKIYTGFNRSTDGGTTWQADTNGLYPERTFYQIAMGTDGSVYAVGWDNLDWDYGPYRQGIFKRANDTWTLLSASNEHGNTFTAVAVAPSNPSVVYAGYVNIVSKSTDAGQTWTNTVAGPWPMYISAIAVDPGNADIVYVGTWYGIYRSVDGGATWTSFGLADFDLRKLAFDASGTSLYASGPGSSIYRVKLGTRAVASPSSHNFGALPVGASSSATFTITNSGPAGMDTGTLTLAGEGAEAFSIVAGSNSCSGIIAVGESCSLAVSFNATAVGERNATLTLGYNSSTEAPLQISLTGTGLDVIPPVSVASLPGGLYRSAQTVSLSASEQATIYYTTDGSEPTTGSAVYAGPIEIALSTVLRFFAVDPSDNSEAVKNLEGYVIDGIAPVTSATPAGGLFKAAVTVTLKADEQATIYYTLDGGEPTTSSSVFVSAIEISATATLKYFAVDTAGNPEAVKSQTYVIDTISPVTTASLPGGYYGPVSVTLSANEAATIYYTLDGSEPTTSSSIYTTPIALGETATLRYFAVDAAGNPESVRTQTYIINAPVASTVVVAGRTVTVTYSENIVQGPGFAAITLAEEGVVIPATVAISGNTLSLVTKNPLQKNTVYTLTVPADAVQDLAGNRQQNPFTTTFVITK